MKKIALALALVLTTTLAVFHVAATAAPISVYVNGRAVEFPDAQPFIDQNNRTQIPIGVLAAELGMIPSWNSDTQTATLIQLTDDINGHYIKFFIGKNTFETGRFSGETGIGFYPEATIAMDTTAILKDNRTFVPARYAAEAFDFLVDWDADNSRVNLLSEQTDAPPTFESKLLSAMPKDQNYMISPFSLKMALAMAANGANGQTRDEILNVLDIADLEQFNIAAEAFIANENANAKVEFNVANSIWNNTDFFKDPTFNFADEYKQTIADHFHGIAGDIDNASGAKTVNDWIALQTNDKIRDVLTDDNIKNTASALVNTIYFKGAWASNFNVEATRDDIFTNRNGKQDTTAFMRQTAYYRYYENAGFQMLAKPYLDTNIRMYIILPKGEDIVLPNLDETIAKMTSENVFLQLPKFKTESMHQNLVDVLMGMGVQAAFDGNRADFSGMYTKMSPNMSISSILQKTFIEVNEAGTEAAAATVVMMAPTGAYLQPPEPIPFNCNRPFLYLIRNDATGDILFMGEYAFVE